MRKELVAEGKIEEPKQIAARDGRSEPATHKQKPEPIPTVGFGSDQSKSQVPTVGTDEPTDHSSEAASEELRNDSEIGCPEQRTAPPPRPAPDPFVAAMDAIQVAAEALKKLAVIRSIMPDLAPVRRPPSSAFPAADVM